MHLLGVRIGADDVASAVRAYATLLDVPPTALPAGGARFRLGRGSVDVVGGPAGLQALRLARAPDEAALEAAYGVAVTTEAAPDDIAPGPASVAIDHVVVRTTDPGRAIALWRDRLGLRLALDREFPARGLRLLFLRSAGMTLEYAAPLPPASGPALDDALYGMSYRVTDLAARRDRLLAAGIDVSQPRPGMRPGTTVVTVRSATAGVPTLLLEVDPPAQ